MIGLIAKDLLILRRSLKFYLLLILFYGLLVILDAFPAAMCASFTLVMLLVLSLSPFAYDEQARWDRYVFALPMSRTAVVKARYCFLLLLALVGTALVGLIGVFLSLTGKSDLEEFLYTVMAALGVGLFIPAVMLPLNYKLGRERAIPFLYAVILIPALGLFLLSRLGILAHVDPSIAGTLLPLLPPFSLAALWRSYKISCRIVEKKEV